MFIFNGGPEPPMEPPEDKYITDDYGYEVYEGEELYEIYSHEKKGFIYLSDENFKEQVEEWMRLDLKSFADDFGIEHHTVTFDKPTGF